MITIRTKDLKSMFDRIIDKLEHEEVEAEEIATDLYRFIPADEWGTFEKDEIILGSLDDDLQMLLLMIKNQDRPCTYVDFDRVASLLRALSQARNPAN
jgi:hypothetical protein